MPVNQYVLGFAFNKDASEVLMVEKTEPDFMKGLLNGIGGRIERLEIPAQTMMRECLEETGLCLDWIYRGQRLFPDDRCPAISNIVYIFESAGNEYLNTFQQNGEEIVKLCKISELTTEMLVQDTFDMLRKCHAFRLH